MNKSSRNTHTPGFVGAYIFISPGRNEFSRQNFWVVMVTPCSAICGTDKPFSKVTSQIYISINMV
jgi:hypothetical protein